MKTASQQLELFSEPSARFLNTVDPVVVHPLGLRHKWLVFWAGPTIEDQREYVETYIAETKRDQINEMARFASGKIDERPF